MCLENVKSSVLAKGQLHGVEGWVKGYRRRAEGEAEEGGQRDRGKARKSTNITLRNWALLCRLAFLKVCVSSESSPYNLL